MISSAAFLRSARRFVEKVVAIEPACERAPARSVAVTTFSRLAAGRHPAASPLQPEATVMSQAHSTQWGNRSC
jgi:hypothetical protein